MHRDLEAMIVRLQLSSRGHLAPTSEINCTSFEMPKKRHRRCRQSSELDEGGVLEVLQKQLGEVVSISAIKSVYMNQVDRNLIDRFETLKKRHSRHRQSSELDEGGVLEVLQKQLGEMSQRLLNQNNVRQTIL
ncbi:uncharacterized protein LOC128880612 [Hylaeus volcanicus]|uniref:uncharacterized protein LOC128880612 n=1 Tax=Hylaeus volcanicus TaxID=313075 RepID=UPI0023B85190|nr:uncharacterized protein LOC128880612 [Hylaeus volcanicus]